MIALSLSMAPTASWVCAAVGALLGMAYNARPIAKLYSATAGMGLLARLGCCLVGQLVMAYLWALAGILLSPAAALAAAWVRWSF